MEVFLKEPRTSGFLVRPLKSPSFGYARKRKPTTRWAFRLAAQVQAEVTSNIRKGETLATNSARFTVGEGLGGECQSQVGIG